MRDAIPLVTAVVGMALATWVLHIVADRYAGTLS
jgi:hypothetical protein